jgi:hypothetical protein
MSRVSPLYMLGFAIPTKFGLDQFVAADSTLTEAGPRPGSAVAGDTLSTLQPRISGEQSDDLVTRVTAAGMPTLTGGLRQAYRKSSEAAGLEKGWNAPNAMSGWFPAEYAAAASATYNVPAACVIPSSQDVIATYVRATGGSSVRCRRFDRDTVTWGAAVEIYAPSSATSKLAIPACVPVSERLLVFVTDDEGAAAVPGGAVYFSDDDGATWALYSAKPYTVPSRTTWLRGRMFVRGNGDALLAIVVDFGGTTHLHQYVSNDVATTFTEVDDWSSPGGTPEVLQLASGRIGCVTINAGTSRPEWRTVGSFYDALADATAADIGTTTVTEVTGYVDYDGTVYVYGRSTRYWYVWKSDDEGDTWELFEYGLFDSGDANTYPTNMTVVPTAGAGFAVHQWTAQPGDEDLSVGGILLGGWSNFTLDSPSNPTSSDMDARRLGFGPTSVAGVTTRTYLPMDLPEDCGWTKTGAGTSTLVAGGLLELATVAQQDYYDIGATGTASRIFAEFEVTVASGSGNLTTPEVGFQASVANGVTDRDIELNIAHDGFQLRDVNAGSDLAVVPIDMTTAMQFKVYLRENLVEVYYKRPSAVTWTLLHSGTLTNAGAPSAAGHARWGHITSGTATSQWRWLQLGWGYAGQPWNSSASTSTSHDNITGKRITILPYPLATFATAGASFLSATRGPGRFDETHTIEVAHDHGIELVFPDVSPSHDEEFRTTTDADDVMIVVQPAEGRDTSFGSRSIVMGLFNTNVPNAFWEGWDGAAWVTLGEYDSINPENVLATAGGVFSGQATALGDQVYPRLAGTAEGVRYIQAGEFIGCDMYVNGTMCKVLDHEEGHWTDKDTRRCRFTVDRAVTSGLAFIVPKNGILVMHNITAVYNKYRIRIPGASTADGYFRIGSIVVGGLTVAGLPASDGWSVDWDPRYREDEDERGTTRRTERGPLRQSLTVSWAEGVPLSSLRSTIIGASAILPNYYSADATHEPLAAQKDVPWLLAGALKRSKSGQHPWLVIQNVPLTATYKTITDPTLFMVGRPESPVSFTQVRGAPGNERLVRVQQFSWKGVR